MEAVTHGSTYLFIAPMMAFSEKRIKELKVEFEEAGIKVIWLLYHGDASCAPRMMNL